MTPTAKRAVLLASAFALFAGSQLDYQPSPSEYNGTRMKKYRKKLALTKKQQKARNKSKAARVARKKNRR